MRFRKLAAVIGLIALTGCVNSSTQSYPPKAIPIELTPIQQKAVMEGIRSSLKDPNSAIFGPAVAGKDSDGNVLVCGLVNARNSYGGYTGNVPYIGMLVLIVPTVPVFTPLGFGGTNLENSTIVSMCRNRIGV